ncbi:hypothetical protein ACJMK2_032585 [Sinanodonta woodiana]|uniref:Uncharacterized protein n=1 Tax=Sinanodonta woodiana TaxID=1069815 RepID=A0ABD3X261_SINWO
MLASYLGETTIIHHEKDRRLSRRKNQRSLEHLKKSFIMSNMADTTTHTVDQVTLPTQLVFTHPPPVTSSITYGNSIPETIIEESYEHNISVKKKNSNSKNSVPVKSVPYSGSMSERKSLYKSREATSQSTDSTSTCDSVNIPLEDSAETGDVSDLEEGRVPTDSDGNFSDQQSEFFRVNSVRSHHGKISPNNSRLQNTVDFLLESKSRGSTRETKIVKRVKFM